MRSIRPGFALLILSLLTVNAAAQEVPVLPPLTEPPAEQLPGKFVWADLITSEFDAARKFYQQLFGLEWAPISGPPSPYGILEHKGYPVAGIAFRAKPDGASAAGHWVHYLSVSDVNQAHKAVEAAGGSTLLGPVDYPARGRLVVVAGPDGEVLGLIRSGTGDPPDYRAEAGDWIWRELLTHEVDASARLFARLCDCDVAPDEQRSGRYLTSSQGFVRAAIGPLSDPNVAAIWVGFVRVSDLRATVAQALSLGAEVLIEPGSTDLDDDLAVIQDPGGGILGLLAWDFADEEAAR